MLGSYRISGHELIFVPRYPLDRSILSYLIEIDPSLLHPSNGQKGANEAPPLSKRIRLVVESPTQPCETDTQGDAIVEAIYPSQNLLPENTLKFYIAFSSPMSRGEAYHHVQLLDEKGRRISDPFLELGEELWSVDGKRFTLLFDPGRIKRGLRPREEVGPVLEMGKSYTLVVDEAWPDAQGRPLARPFRKSFRVGAPDETIPDPKGWTIRPPQPMTSDPLVVRFSEPLDRALAERLIGVVDPAGAPVDGTVDVRSGETVWTLDPRRPWKAGEHRLIVGVDLEDLAGNSVRRRFEVDLVEPITRNVEATTVSIPFRVEP
jgi:hypothetical protein